MLPLVSVILPIYNAESTICDAINSILNQTYQNFELIAINDGSTDSSEAIVLSYTDSRIKYYKNDINKGLIYTLNKGLSLSNGKYIARMDADDISLSTRIEKQVDFMEKNKNIILLGGQMEFFGEKNGIAYKQPINDSDIRDELLYHSTFYHPTVIFRNDIIKNNNLKYNKEYLHAEDYKFWSDLSLYGEMMNLNDIVLKYRVSKEQISNKYNKTQLLTTKIIKRENLERLFKIYEYEFCNNISSSTIKSITYWLYKTNNKMPEKQKRILLILYYLSWKYNFKFLHLIFTRNIIRLKSIKHILIILFDSIGLNKWEHYKF